MTFQFSLCLSFHQQSLKSSPLLKTLFLQLLCHCLLLVFLPPPCTLPFRTLPGGVIHFGPDFQCWSYFRQSLSPLYVHKGDYFVFYNNKFLIVNEMRELIFLFFSQKKNIEAQRSMVIYPSTQENTSSPIQMLFCGEISIRVALLAFSYGLTYSST